MYKYYKMFIDFQREIFIALIRLNPVLETALSHFECFFLEFLSLLSFYISKFYFNF